MRRGFWVLAVFLGAAAAGCAGRTNDDRCADPGPAPGAGCDELEVAPEPPKDPVDMPAKPTPKPTPTPKPACPESPPAVGTPCTNAMTCSYADYSDACGFTPTEVECSGGTWSESDTGTCTSGSSCNPLGTWSIDAEPAGPDEWCGTNGPPSKVSVLPGPNGSLKSEWDASVSADGCKLHLHDYYEYDQYETGSESRDLKLDISGDTATGTYSFAGDGFSMGGCSVKVVATRAK